MASTFRRIPERSAQSRPQAFCSTPVSILTMQSFTQQGTARLHGHCMHICRREWGRYCARKTCRVHHTGVLLHSSRTYKITEQNFRRFPRDNFLLVIRENLRWRMQYVLAGSRSAIPERRKHVYQMNNTFLQGNFKQTTHFCSRGAG